MKLKVKTLLACFIILIGLLTFQATTESAIQLNTIMPVVDIISPSSDVVYQAKDKSINLFGLAFSCGPLESVTFSINDGEEKQVSSLTPQTNFTLWTINNVNLEKGENLIKITARDSLGGESSDIIEVHYLPMISSSKKIGARGGEISLTDGTRINVPAGSLNKDVKITLQKVENENFSDTCGGIRLLLSPSGLSFNKPVQISYPFNPSELGADEFLAVYNVKKDGVIEPVPAHVESNRVNVSISHFSILVSTKEKAITTVLHLPGEYLKESDLLYTLTRNYFHVGDENQVGWLPGHAALYLGTRSATDNLGLNDGQTIVEAPGDAIRFSSISSLIEENHHIYMGARHYREALNAQDRKNIASFAISKLGKKYNELPFPWSNDWSGYSCVGLTEQAYDSAGKSIVKLEFPALTPHHQYINTDPVDEITLKAGDPIEFPVKAVICNRFRGLNDYREENACAAEGLRKDLGMKFENGQFSWTKPKLGVYNLKFKSSACVDGKNYEAVQPLTITVLEGHYSVQLIWGDSPQDLDSHLTGPLPDGTVFHMYYPYAESRSGSPWPDYVKLDWDDTDGYGPEITSIYQQINGVYRFSVHDYTNRGRFSFALSQSKAQVRLFREGVLVQTFSVPRFRMGTLWTVFELNGDRVIPVNSLTSESDPGSVTSLEIGRSGEKK